MNREAVYSALFSAVREAVEPVGVKTCSRKLRHWSDVPAPQQPAVFQIQRRETCERKRGIPQKWFLFVDLYIYVNSSDDPSAAPTTLLNPILDALENAFPSEEPDGPITLGGLASHCWLRDPIETSEGVLGDQEIAIVPVEVVGGE